MRCVTKEFNSDYNSRFFSMSFVRLTNDNFIMYAMKHYDNPQCSGVDEFTEDLNNLKYIRKFLTVYDKKGELKERIIINNLITFYNVFGIVPATRMLFFKLPPNLHCYLKTFLLFLNFLPSNDPEVVMQIDVSKIPVDINIARVLREV